MPYDARAIANEFLKLKEGPANQMWLQKLVYIAHGWNLAINGEPLVEDRIEAWDGGPVLRIIWNHLRDLGFNAKGGLLGKAEGKPFKAELSGSEKAIIRHVWKRYGSYTGNDLSRMTHQEGTPWSNAYFGMGRNAALKNDDIKQHFTELALAGRT
ncbi:Panacea domain-containing protein [Qipengyuania marisflavi]|uniref:DUF4065 domain-containing protein n=1 Tax=Qipengyuania marisflavi TaxID=2486356 RepID=A0A5S3P5I1_9SPHN|nr:Panacea domain-containing protein [Qipengyuania marisflavi]TMM48277.1 DUF4065 domain-containing protein [Qipengyuania marisflavi]